MRRPRLEAISLAVFAALASLPTGARADEPGVADCVAANERSGPLRHQGKLREARAELRRCSASSCPREIQEDCVRGVTQIDVAVPSVIFAVRDGDGNDRADVVVTMDGETIAERLDGKPIEVDPGEHVFRLTATGQPVIERRLVILEGEKDRRERFLLGPPPAPPPVAPTVLAPPPPPLPPATGPEAMVTRVTSNLWNDQRTLGFVLGAVGLVGIGVGAVTGIVTFTSWGDAKSACGGSISSHCADAAGATSDRSTAVTTGAVSTVAFVAGGLALAGGALLVFTAPSRSGRETVSFAPTLGPGGGGLRVGGTFR